MRAEPSRSAQGRNTKCAVQCSTTLAGSTRQTPSASRSPTAALLSWNCSRQRRLRNYALMKAAMHTAMVAIVMAACLARIVPAKNSGSALLAPSTRAQRLRSTRTPGGSQRTGIALRCARAATTAAATNRPRLRRPRTVPALLAPCGAAKASTARPTWMLRAGLAQSTGQ